MTASRQRQQRAVSGGHAIPLPPLQSSCPCCSGGAWRWARLPHPARRSQCLDLPDPRTCRCCSSCRHRLCRRRVRRRRRHWWATVLGSTQRQASQCQCLVPVDGNATANAVVSSRIHGAHTRINNIRSSYDCETRCRGNGAVSQGATPAGMPLRIENQAHCADERRLCTFHATTRRCGARGTNNACVYMSSGCGQSGSVTVR